MASTGAARVTSQLRTVKLATAEIRVSTTMMIPNPTRICAPRVARNARYV